MNETRDSELDELDEDVERALTKRVEDRLTQLGLDDLIGVADETLANQDSASVSRLTYVAALLRLLAYLRARPRDGKQQRDQASVGLAYIKHIENTNMRALQLGRSTADQQLAIEVAEMRRQLAALATYRKRYPGELIDTFQVVPSAEEASEESS